jgi:rhodanese-related sulfurtransferase
MENTLPEISVAELAEWMVSKPDIVLLDVREPDETTYVPLPDPRVVTAPLSMLARQMEKGLPEAVKPEAVIVVFCHLGQRSAQVTAWLSQNLGYPQVYNLRGGIDAYAREVDAGIRKY